MSELDKKEFIGLIPDGINPEELISSAQVDKAPMIIHLGTIVRSTFGVLDLEGNVIPLNPVELTLRSCTSEAFLEALSVINSQKKDVEEKIVDRIQALRVAQ